MNQSTQQHPPNAEADRRRKPGRRLALVGIPLLVALLIIGAGIFYLAFLAAQKNLNPSPLVWQLFGGGLLILGLLTLWLTVRLLNKTISLSAELSEAESAVAQPDGQALLKQEERSFAPQSQEALEQTAAALYRVTRILAQMNDEQEMFELLLTEYLQFLDLQQGGVLLINDDKTHGTLKAHMIDGKLVEPGLQIMVAGNPSLEQLIETRQPLLIQNALEDKLVEPIHGLNEALGIKSLLLLPIIVRGEVIGALGADATEDFYEFTDREISFGKSMADQLGIALENRRLYHEIHQYLEELTTLNIISQIINSTLDLEEMLAIITTNTLRLLEVSAASVALYDEEQGDLWFAAASGDGSDHVREKRLPMGEGIIGWVAEHGEPVLVPDASKDSRTFDEFDRESGFSTRSILCVPLQTKGRTFGAIEAINKEGVFNEDDLRMLNSLAASAATAIENARLFKQAQQEIAERAQTEETLQETVERLEMVNKQAVIYAQELKEEIIERKRAETALEEERASLAQRVTERTAELQAANEELARAARLKDEFLASMSHELRTPLSAILGLSEVMKSEIYGSLNEKQHKSLSNIEESGRHLLALINDILDLSKIGAGKLELQIGTVPVASVCQASLQMIKETAQKKQITISSTIDEQVTILQADERRLKQVLINLLSNAVKFTPEGGEIGLEVAGDVAQQEVRFTVWDTGIGIPAEKMEYLFQPFVQLDGSLSRQFGGTGLGLALVQRMVQLHDGNVSVESEVGQGSRFTITFPWLDSEVTTSSTTVTSAPSTALEPSHPVENESSKKSPSPSAKAQSSLILLVEDDQRTASFVESYLAARGYQVTVAHDGAQAIERATKMKPDLILMDIQMPQMNGLEATRRIRNDSDSKVATTPIIALTALAMSSDREQCLKAGANDYLSKPLKFKRLIEAIETQLNRKRIAEKGLS